MPELKRNTSTLNNQHGATVIEFAVVVFWLLLFVIGMLELSFYFLQRHYVANAAREGVRIGIRANNFNCFDIGDSSLSCQSAAERVYRRGRIISKLTDCSTNPKGYLCALYENDMAQVIVNVSQVAPAPIYRKVLRVEVTTPNFFPQLLSRLAPTRNRDTISYTATGDYEDAEEP